MKPFIRFVPVYLMGLFVGIALLIARILGIWKITGMENMPSLKQKGSRGIIVVSNHPSLLEPIALLGLFFHWYSWNPFYGPWNMPERKNFDRGIFRLMKPRLVFVERGVGTSGARSFIRARDLLRKGSIFLLFPEGGRTGSGDAASLIVGPRGRRIRPFKEGAAILAMKTGALVLPMWVEGTDAVSPNLKVVRYPFPRFWKPVRISIGKAFVMNQADSPQTATEELQRAVLEA